MATLLDTGLFDQFSVIFTWILLFLVVFGILEVTNVFKNRNIHVLLAFVVAILASTSTLSVGIVETMLPWFLIIAFFVFFVYMIGNFMGIGNNEILQAMGGGDRAIWWILVLGFLIVAAALSNSFGEELLDERGEGTQDDSQRQVILALTNPKVLGLGLIFIIGAFTILFMAGAGRIS